MTNKNIGLSVIIPVFNEETWMKPTIQHLYKALRRTSFEYEIIVVDDGSVDNSADMAELTIGGFKIPGSVIRQKNSGRYLARKRGVIASKYTNILFIDSRVLVDVGSLSFLYKQIKRDQNQIWNGHVNIEKQGNIFARFWDAIVYVAWRRYFKHPRNTSYGLKDFDYYPKGTGFFFVPKKILSAAMKFFESTTNDLKFSSDDTLLIRNMAEKQNIHLSPKFSCIYHSRSNLVGFLKHAFGRGQFFIDGFLRRGTRFFIPLIGILGLSIIMFVLLLFKPVLVLYILIFGLLFFVTSLFIGGLILGVILPDAFALATLCVPFAIVYLAGLWRGLMRKII